VLYLLRSYFHVLAMTKHIEQRYCITFFVALDDSEAKTILKLQKNYLKTILQVSLVLKRDYTTNLINNLFVMDRCWCSTSRFTFDGDLSIFERIKPL